MEPSSAMCRTQEAFQRDRASNTLLGNVRSIAEKAAAAWANEAILAEHRELRRERVRIVGAGLVEEKQRLRTLVELAENENPDRGLV